MGQDLGSLEEIQPAISFQILLDLIDKQRNCGSFLEVQLSQIEKKPSP